MPRSVNSTTTPMGRATMAAERIYAAALTGYPRRLRRRYGDQMRDTFAARCRDAAERGTPAIAALLAHEPTDLASASIAERRTPASPLRIAATIECRVAGNADINRPILALATITLDEQGEGLRAQGSGLTT